jgi:hypothetical protein
VAAACGRWPGERRPRERQHRAAIARAVAALEYGSWVLEARFAKMGFRTWVELRRFRYDLAIMADCCPGRRRIRHRPTAMLVRRLARST